MSINLASLGGGRVPYPIVTVDSFVAGIVSHFSYQNGNCLLLRVTAGPSGWGAASGAAPLEICRVKWPNPFIGFPLVGTTLHAGDLTIYGDNAVPTGVTTLVGGAIDHSTWAVRAIANSPVNAVIAAMLILPDIGT